jgi:3-hydroxyacyl-CoA dehydrogenase
MHAKIEKVLVLGASGTVGSLVGGLLAQNGIKVRCLSRTLEGTAKGVERAQAQARSEVIDENITCGEYKTMLEKACGEADWIIECVVEDVAVKQQMYKIVDKFRRPDSIVSSITSSIPLAALTKGMSASFNSHFLSTHFYNPPAKMSACEICGTPLTDPAIVTYMADFIKTRLRRTVVPVNPIAGFAGNRIAFLLFAHVTRLVEERGVELVDYLIGPYTGRVMPPLATIDLVGLDVHTAIIKSLMKNTNAMNDVLSIPPYIDEMIKNGCLGRKTPDRGGFYKVLEGGKRVFIDPASGSYIAAIRPHIRFVEEAKDLVHLGKYKKAFQTILNTHGEEANIVKKFLAMYITYSYTLVGEVSEAKFGIKAINAVMSTGFNWASPSLIVSMIGGKTEAIALIESQQLTVPDQLRDEQEVTDLYHNCGKYFPAK